MIAKLLPLSCLLPAIVLCSCEKQTVNENAAHFAAIKTELSNLRSEVSSLRSSVASGAANSQTRFQSEINSLRSVGSRLDDIDKHLQKMTGDIEGLKEPHSAASPAPPATPPPESPPPSKTLREELPFGTPVVGRKGMVYSPYAPERGQVDVAGLKRGTRVKCPYTGHHFRAP
ncbi:MAG TPA: hypothetical protein VG796_12315 [Verrucomicrobiales bacterium]|jgi:hypothetical protein|nr:hypothetical protein [Verrucomicrobiales bacterium]